MDCRTKELISYKRKLLRVLKRIKKATNENNVELVKELVDELIEDEEKDIDDVVTVEKEKKKSDVQKTEKEESSKVSVEKVLTYGVPLLEEEDKDYLQFKSQRDCMSMSDFFWKLIDEDIKDISAKNNIETEDEEHSKFRRVKLPTMTTVKATQKQKDSLMTPAAKHQLKPTRYVAYVVHEARLNDKTW